MSTNVEKARRWYREVWRPGGESTVRELMAEGATGHMEGAIVTGRDAFLAERARLLTAFPDLVIQVEDVIAEGDKVVVRWHVNAPTPAAVLGCRRRTVRFVPWHDVAGVREWPAGAGLG